MAGAPKGNRNAANGQFARAALVKALEKRAGYVSSNEILSRFKTLVEIWDVQIDKALEGDSSAANMIVDRMDGKPKVMETEESTVPQTIQVQIVKPDDTNTGEA